MTDPMDFRRRKRPGWSRPSANGEPAPIKRLRGLDEFVKPSFVGRMDRVRRRQQLVWYAMLIAAVSTGAAIGLTLI